VDRCKHDSVYSCWWQFNCRGDISCCNSGFAVICVQL